MRVLVTGAAGFVGSHVCETLQRRGHDLVAVDCFLPDLYSSSVKRDVAAELRQSGVSVVEADLRSDDISALFDGVDAVINEAAMPGLMPSWSSFETYVGCNVLAVERLARAALDAKVSKFVQISTSSVYGRHAVGDEHQATEPFSPYGVTKLAAENILNAYRTNFGLPTVTLRYFSIYGPRQRPDMAYHRFIEAILDDQSITVFGDGLQSRTNTYVADAAEGTALALEKGEDGEVYNIGGGVQVTLLEAIDLIGAACGRTPRMEFESARPGDQRETSADWTKANHAFGYAPTVPPAEGLARQVEWHLAQRDHR